MNRTERSPEAIAQGVCHTEDENMKFYTSLDPDTKAPALAALRESTTPVDLDLIREKFAADPDGWYVPYHFWWGMGVRNFLREKGFGEEYFKVDNLDDIYIYLVEEALNLHE